MQNIQLFYDAVSNIVFDANGKEYPIKEYNRCKQVNFNDGKIAVSKLPQKPLIRNFEDVCFHYMFCWHRTHPCIAIGYMVYRKRTGSKITLKEYFKINTK